jgi:hypothetical protein
MNIRRIEERIDMVGAASWGAIATGVFVALAIQTLLLLLGVAFGVSVGDEALGSGYAVWAVLVQLCSIAIGAALAAALSHTDNRTGGSMAGFLVWAVALVLGGILSGLFLPRRIDETGAWSAFFGAALSLIVALIGGAIGARLNRHRAGMGGEPLIRDEEPLTAHPMGVQ